MAAAACCSNPPPTVPILGCCGMLLPVSAAVWIRARRGCLYLCRQCAGKVLPHWALVPPAFLLLSLPRDSGTLHRCSRHGPRRVRTATLGWQSGVGCRFTGLEVRRVASSQSLPHSRCPTRPVSIAIASVGGTVCLQAHGVLGAGHRDPIRMPVRVPVPGGRLLRMHSAL